MKNVKSNRDYYDEFSVRYEDNREHGYHALLNELEADAIRPHIANKTVLELGCGTGQILSLLREDAAQLVGMDLSSGMLQKSKERGFCVTQGDITQIPFKGGQFDAVYSVKTLPHVQELDRGFREIDRVLKPGGYLFLEFYNANSLRGLKWQIKNVLPGKISDSTHEKSVYTKYQTAKELEQAFLPNWKRVQVSGLMTFAPHPALYSIPGISGALGSAERWAANSFARGLGGFLLFMLQKNN